MGYVENDFEHAGLRCVNECKILAEQLAKF